MWQGIEGHDDVVRQFRRTLACGRLASSYLFVGPEGIGKFSFALKLAEALLCQRSSSGQTREDPLDPCGQCGSCRLFRQDPVSSTPISSNQGKGGPEPENGDLDGTCHAPSILTDIEGHPDLDIIQCPEGKQSLSIDLFIGDRAHRNQTGLCHNIALRPRFGQRRVAIIDDADLLGQESANVLLKTLEEPPAGAVIILIGTSRSHQLPTVLSRTQVVRFTPLDHDLLANLLDQLGIASDMNQAKELAALGEGSVAHAQQFAAGPLVELRARLVAQLAAKQFQSVPLTEELIQFVNEAGKEANLRRRRLRAVIMVMVDIFRQRLRSAATDPTQQHNSDGPSLQQTASMTHYTAQHQTIEALDRSIEAQQQLDRNANQTTLLACWLDDLAMILRGSRKITY